MLQFPRVKISRGFVFLALLSLVSMPVGLAGPTQAGPQTFSVADLAGHWQAALVWSGSGCGPASGLVNMNLDSTGTDNSATFVFHGACGDSASTQTFTIQFLNPDGSGAANLSCGIGCGWQLVIQVNLDRSVINMVDVEPTNPGNFVAGTAIRQM